jgi:hypothetical protein
VVNFSPISEVRIVMNHRHAIGGEPYVEFDSIGTEFARKLKSNLSIFWGGKSSSSVSKDQGHISRIMSR